MDDLLIQLIAVHTGQNQDSVAAALCAVSGTV
jgi:hypothetical protein